MKVLSKPLNLAGIDALRGVAASVVVAYHAARHLDKAYGAHILMAVFQFGHAGVDLFFVLSGFIIYFAHSEDVGRPNRLGHYLRRRFTRVFPVYWVALFVTIFLSLSGGHVFPSISDIVLSLALLPSHAEPLLGVAWTLQYEIVFYALFCLSIFNKKLGILTFSIWFLGILFAKLGVPFPDSLPPSISGMYNLEFFFGIAAGHLFERNKIVAPLATFLIGCSLFVGVAALEDLQVLDGYADVARIAYGVPALLIVGGLAEQSRRGFANIGSLLKILGGASYSIYLFQFIFIGIFWKIRLALNIVEPHVLVCFFVLALSGIGGGVMTHYLVERPILRLVRRKPHEARPPQSSASDPSILPIPHLAGAGENGTPVIPEH